MDLELKSVKAICDLTDDVSIIVYTASFGASFPGPVNSCDCRPVVNPENNVAGGGTEIGEEAKMKEEFQTCRYGRQRARLKWN
jgi:hypothetical protein